MELGRKILYNDDTQTRRPKSLFKQGKVHIICNVKISYCPIPRLLQPLTIFESLQPNSDSALAYCSISVSHVSVSTRVKYSTMLINYVVNSATLSSSRSAEEVLA